jgi:hypothetical protein
MKVVLNAERAKHVRAISIVSEASNEIRSSAVHLAFNSRPLAFRDDAFERFLWILPANPQQKFLHPRARPEPTVFE